MLSGSDSGAGKEKGIMGFKEKFSHFNGGSNNNREGAETEMRDGAVFFGELVN